MNRGRALRRIRIAVETVLAVAIAVMFLVPVAQYAPWLQWLGRLQWLPSAIAFALPVCVGWLLVTMLFGRVYCSTICPLGAAQDLVSRLRRMVKRKQFHFRRPDNGLRYPLLLVVIVCLAEGIAIVPSLLEPYSAFGRVMQNIVRPGLWGCVVALLTVLMVGTLSWRNGRTWCNTVCPVGSLLGIVSRYSVCHIDINTDKCIQCRKCEHACKSRCIDLQSHTVDMSRCVVCFDCLPVCPNDAIHYTPSSHRLQLPMMQRLKTGPARPSLNADSGGAKLIDRRRFLAQGVIVALSPLALKAERVLPHESPVALPKLPPIAPPGAADLNRFLARCTNCGLCVAQCPSGVIRPSGREYGVKYVLHPLMDYDRAACLYDCTVCNTVCPSGALDKLSLHEKQHSRLGLAHVVKANCVGCGCCERACPVGAVKVVDGKAKVNLANCIGCGACQNACPVKPYKAIYVAPLT